MSTSISLLICATVVMVISLIPSQPLVVLAYGLLLGGVFTMVYSGHVAERQPVAEPGSSSSASPRSRPWLSGT